VAEVPTVHLKRGNAKPLHSGHPWVFADAISRTEGQVQPGDEVRVVDERGTCLGRGFISPQSAIAVRLLTRADAPITDALLISRIDEAIRLRHEILRLAAPSDSQPAAAALHASPKKLALPDKTIGPAELSDKQAVQLEQLDDQVRKIERFAAQYGMDAGEETAELRRKRDDLARQFSPAPATASPAKARIAAPAHSEKTTAYRLINSEGDGLPGLIADVYGDCIAVQIGTAGIERRSTVLLDALEERLSPRAIVDRSDARTRTLEKLPPPRLGALRGTAPVEAHSVFENGIELLCDLRDGAGQKTGLYMDQRENRRRFAEFAPARHVLDVFSYTGSFALHAARAGAASITLVESSAEALEQARDNLERNGVDDADLIHAQWPEGFKHLREQGRQFDLVALDPPKFARARENVAQALSAYRDLNAQAARLVSSGGVLFTCSCSGNVSEMDFERAVAGGIATAGRRAMLLERRGAAADHPVPPGFDQGNYLKCLILRII